MSEIFISKKKLSVSDKNKNKIKSHEFVKTRIVEGVKNNALKMFLNKIIKNI